MNENIPTNDDTAEKMTPRQEKINLAMELFESAEVFPFPGIDIESYNTIKQEQEEYPGYTTPIDELLVRFKSEGLKVVLNKSQMDVLILPAGSDDLMNDFLLPRNMSTEGEIDPRLLTLITVS